jgi:hypothetical protein
MRFSVNPAWSFKSSLSINKKFVRGYLTMHLEMLSKIASAELQEACKKL